MGFESHWTRTRATGPAGPGRVIVWSRQYHGATGGSPAAWPGGKDSVTVPEKSFLINCGAMFSRPGVSTPVTRELAPL